MFRIFSLDSHKKKIMINSEINRDSHDHGTVSTRAFTTRHFYTNRFFSSSRLHCRLKHKVMAFASPQKMVMSPTTSVHRGSYTTPFKTPRRESAGFGFRTSSARRRSTSPTEAGRSKSAGRAPSRSGSVSPSTLSRKNSNVFRVVSEAGFDERADAEAYAFIEQQFAREIHRQETHERAKLNERERRIQLLRQQLEAAKAAQNKRFQQFRLREGARVAHHKNVEKKAEVTRERRISLQAESYQQLLQQQYEDVSPSKDHSYIGKTEGRGSLVGGVSSVAIAKETYATPQKRASLKSVTPSQREGLSAKR